MLSKQKIFSIITVFVLLSTTMSVSVPAYAATSTTSNGGFFSNLVTFISQKFGLDQNQVKSAVADFQTQQKQNRLTNLQNAEKKHLDTLVTQGKITNAQETAIINELATLRSKYMTNSSQTPAERKTAMRNMVNDWNTWAKNNNIDPKIILPFGGRFMIGHGFRRWAKFGSTSTPTPTP